VSLSRRGFLGALFFTAVGAATAKTTVIADYFRPAIPDIDPTKALAASTSVDMETLNAIFKEVYGPGLERMMELMAERERMYARVFHEVRAEWTRTQLGRRLAAPVSLEGV
jgi:hypothetical protein